MNRIRLMLLASGVLLTLVSARAGELRLGTPTVEGNQVSFPVILDGDIGGGVSSASFRLRYDPDVLRPLSAIVGEAAAAADKQVAANVPQDGEYALVLMGMNQNTFGGGEVATITMERVDSAEESQTGLRITQTSLAASDASEIPSQGSSATVQLALDSAQVEQEADDDSAVASERQEEASPGAQPNDSGTAAGAQPRGAATAGTGVPDMPPPSLERSTGTIAEATERAEALRNQLPQRAGDDDTPMGDPASAVSSPATATVAPVESGSDPTVSVDGTAGMLPAPGQADSPEESLQQSDAKPVDTPATARPTAEGRPNPKAIVVGIIVVAVIAVLLLRKKLFG